MARLLIRERKSRNCMQVSPNTSISCTAFVERDCFAKGTLQHVVITVKENLEDSKFVQLLTFNDLTGKPIDIDFRGNTAEVLERLNSQAGYIPDTKEHEQPARRVGRPKLGVVSGEVTLLPRHWDWLKAQPGGASVTLRRLIDEARRSGGETKVKFAQHSKLSFYDCNGGRFPSI
ncbi:hypothetical protein J2Z28_003857 [Paenibacillus xylanexedens]|uniref:DUF2239 family protein n=2 Tax=Paenibacillus xylanexedens TaxID=528191 RepID=A0ABS4RWD2_PAEXY|nr:hypothetical protein [Paenibacillus xylanexedens]